MRAPSGTLLALALLLASPMANTAAAYSAGYEVLRITDTERARPIQLDVWYPAASSREEPHSYGFGMGHVASHAMPANGRFPLLLLSHGANGAASNYSWLAEGLARRGYVVLGVSHYVESPVFGASSIDPAAARRLDERLRDFHVALDFLLRRSAFEQMLDADRVGAIGHSSGGASVLLLAGAEFSGTDMESYCRSRADDMDRGCRYLGAGARTAASMPRFAQGPRLRVVVVMDPAAGPALTESSLRALSVPTLVLGSANDDFLPYAAHAGRIAALMPRAAVHRLDADKGHFVFLDECTLPLEVMGVPLCTDRPSVKRAAIHETLLPEIAAFLADHMGSPDR